MKNRKKKLCARDVAIMASVFLFPLGVTVALSALDHDRRPPLPKQSQNGQDRLEATKQRAHPLAQTSR